MKHSSLFKVLWSRGVAIFVLGVACLLSARTAQAQAGTVLLQDDFNGTAMDATLWNVYDSTYFLHRTQFGKQPTLGSENGTTFVRLNLDTYNPDPSAGASNIKGTEMFSKASFPVGSGGVEYEARVRDTNVAPGLVAAFYSFGGRGVYPDSYLWDEVDFEMLGNYSPDRLWLNVWDDYSPLSGGLNEAAQPFVPGLNRNTWNIYKIRTYDYVTQWLVNDVLVRQSYNITPVDAMGVHFNLWAPNSTWTAAYNAAIAPAANSSNNATYFFDVDYVKVRALPSGTIGNGTGLSATYFDNADLTGSTVARVDPRVNFDWGNGSPDTSIASDTFSARWTGQVQAQFSEAYTFTTRSDDGVRLWINNQKVIDNWTAHGPTDDSATIALVAGTKYDIRLEYYEGTFGATMQLFWSSPSTPKRIIPQSQLYPTSFVNPTPTPVPTAAPTPLPSSGNGLSATYFDNANFTGATVARIEPALNFDWGNGSPAAAIAPDSFSARWTGQVQAQFTESYTFYARADDGIRVWVNGLKIIDGWKDQGPTEYAGSINFMAGAKYDIVVEYYENLFGATAQLRWSSASTPKSIVPQSQLFAAPIVTPTPVPTPTPAASGTGTGLSATYFDNSDFTGTSIARVDPQVDFDWGNGSPSASIGPDSFSARWTGQVQAPWSESYIFTTRSDDGVRLWVNGQKLIDNWTEHGPTEDNASIALQAGVKYDIRLEYFESAYGAKIQLAWGSPSIPQTVTIPTSRLYPQSPTALSRVASRAGGARKVMPKAPAPKPPIAPSPLSAGAINTARGWISLAFRVPLNADLADDAARYRVEIGGIVSEIESVSVVASRNLVVLGVPEGALKRGARVKVLWSRLRDRSGRPIADGFWQGVAG